MDTHTFTPGWFKATRNPDMPDLIRQSQKAFVVAYIIAYRSRWNADIFNPFGLDIGEAVIDYERWGMTRQEFRTAKSNLEEWGYATFRTTNRQTIGRLIDSRLFDVLPPPPNQQSNREATNGSTSKEPTANREATNKQPPTKNIRAEDQKKGSRPRELWQIQKDLRIAEERRERLRNMEQSDQIKQKLSGANQAIKALKRELDECLASKK